MADFKTNPLTKLGAWLGSKAKNSLELIAAAPRTAWKIVFDLKVMSLIYLALFAGTMGVLAILGPWLGIIGLGLGTLAVLSIPIAIGALFLTYLSPYILPLIFTAATAIVGALVGLASLVAFGLSAITTIVSYLAADVLIPLMISADSGIKKAAIWFYDNALTRAGQWIANTWQAGINWVKTDLPRHWTNTIQPRLERVGTWANENILKPVATGLKYLGISTGLALTSPLWVPIAIGLEIGKFIGRRLYSRDNEAFAVRSPASPPLCSLNRGSNGVYRPFDIVLGTSPTHSASYGSDDSDSSAHLLGSGSPLAPPRQTSFSSGDSRADAHPDTTDGLWDSTRLSPDAPSINADEPDDGHGSTYKCSFL